ncbi:hypothetical protein V6x_20080 [Gimesia chilikensis]|uniref:Intein C-terminal splicing domain-containing protein n=1 Tax=Gimesia chilikensis TaxID=2605989 RepID=A0A517WAM4_9PLAN|nr:polymorphic toxin-type HINT domain-containing protein [Gimesia chilikensis]QDU02306.1 hypothetical protein V6x_20080 [Gimesia chilikensis]
MSDFVRELSIFSCLLFTSFCFWKVGTGLIGGVDASVLPSAQAAIHSSVTPQRLQTTPIQKMHPGIRVLGRNPDRWDTQPVMEPNPVSWRLVSVRMEQQPGQFVLGQLLRPTSWIRQNDALPGAVIQLEIPEMHVAGDAEVLSITECPPIRRGSGSVVTGTFQHVSDEVISVFVEGEETPIGTTAKHPFWSRDRDAFIPAGELRIGEELKTALGTSTRVSFIEIRAGPELVYNLEVADEHVYQIADACLLVHNASVGNNATRLGANSRVNHSRYYERKILRGDINKASRPTDRVYRRKHLNARTDEQARELSRGIGTSDRRPEASYLPEFIKNIA